MCIKSVFKINVFDINDVLENLQIISYIKVTF